MNRLPNSNKNKLLKYLNLRIKRSTMQLLVFQNTITYSDFQEKITKPMSKVVAAAEEAEEVAEVAEVATKAETEKDNQEPVERETTTDTT